MRLTEGIPIGSVHSPSRVIFGPHETNLGQGRAIGDRHLAYYARRAAGGAGVIVTETASVTDDDWPYERAPLAADCGPGWRALAQACRPYGTVLLAGVGHAGGQGSSAYSQSVMWAPSRVADVVTREPPAELEPDGIRAIVKSFAAAARIAVAAGLHGVEVDSGAWSLLRQFQSALTNQRSDGYGQDRLRFTREVLESVRHAIGPDRVLALRLSCDELAPWAGITPEAAALAVAELAGSIDLLTVVRAGPYSTGAYRPDAHTPAATNRDLCRSMRDAASGKVPVVLQGSVVEPDVAECALVEGVADLVEMTRAQIADARLVRVLRDGGSAGPRPCVLCNQTCRVRDNRNPIVTCIGDPSAGHETTDPDVDHLNPAGEEPPVLIVGGGPAGLECARVLAATGRRVGIAERGDRIGGTVAAAAVGPGRERIRQLTDWLAAECARLGVDFGFGRDIDAPAVAAARADGWEVVLTTGSHPLSNRYSSTGRTRVVDALHLLTVGPDQLSPGPVVVDDTVGDWVGAGIAEWLAGSTERAITIISPDPVVGTLLSRTGDLADANVRLQRAGVDRRLRSRITAIGDGHVEVADLWTAEASVIPAAVLVDCGHRIPDDRLFEEVDDPGVLRAGDCVAPRTVHEAVLEGRRVALSLLGDRSPAGAAAHR